MDKTIQIYDSTQLLHRTLIENIIRVRDSLAELPLKDMVDIAYALREISRLLDDGRKECAECIKLMERAMCIGWIQQCIQTGSDDPIRGEYAIGTTQTRQMMHIPKRDTEEYESLLSWLGVPNDGLVRPHWPSMVEHISELLSEGKTPPTGMTGKPYPVYSVVLRKKKEFHDG